MLRRLLMLALLTICLLPSTSAPAQTLKAVATTTDVGELYRIIGGDRVELEVLCKGYQDPHYLQAKPSFASKMRRADLVSYIGLELEIGYLPLLLEASRNRNLVYGASGNVPLSVGIEVLEIPHGQVSRASGDVHPLGNPHYWLDPRNLRLMAETVEMSLVRLDPEGADEYHARKEAFLARLDEAIVEWELRMAPHRGKQIVCYHKQWEYLTNWLGLSTLDYVENKAGIPPSPRHLSELVANMAHHRIPIILSANFVDDSPTERLAEDTGAMPLILPASVGGEDGVDDFFMLFDLLTARLDAAFRASEGP